MRLDVNKDSQEKCVKYDVYFNGVLQRLCVVADEEKGLIERYKFGIGRVPVKDRTGKFATQILHGKVEIRRKGEAKQDRAEQADNARAGAAGAVPEGAHTAAPERAVLGEATAEGTETR